MLFQTGEVQRPIFKGCWSHDYPPQNLANENEFASLDWKGYFYTDWVTENDGYLHSF